MLLKTVQVGQLLGCTPWRLMSTLRSGKMQPPRKDVSGDYTWTQADIEAARHAMNTDLRRKENRQQEDTAGAK